MASSSKTTTGHAELRERLDLFDDSGLAFLTGSTKHLVRTARSSRSCRAEEVHHAGPG